MARGRRDHDDRGAVLLTVFVTVFLDGKVGRDLATHQLGIQRSFDLRYFRALGARGKSGGGSGGAGASGAANAVNEVLRDLREIVVHHVSDAFHVNAARGDIGGHQYPIIAVLKAAQRLGALALAAVAVDGRGLQTLARQLLR
jgi:hypothetical protein